MHAHTNGVSVIEEGNQITESCVQSQRYCK